LDPGAGRAVVRGDRAEAIAARRRPCGCSERSQSVATSTSMTVYLVNPGHLSCGIGVIPPRWVFVVAGATPAVYGRPQIVDETLEPFDVDAVRAGDIVGIGIHTGNALRGYEIGKRANERGASVVFGGIHATLYPNEAHQ